MSEETINRLKDYSKKLHERRLIPDPHVTDTIEVLAYNPSKLSSRVQLSYGLGYALNLFDTTNPKSEHYHNIVDFFNRCISLCVANDAFKDNKIIVEVQEWQKKYSELETRLNQETAKNEALIEKIGFLRGKLEVYERDTPKSDTLDGDIERV